MSRYTLADLAMIENAIQEVRNHPNFYLGPDGRVSGEYLSSRLVSDLIWLGALPARVERFGDWWVISSEKDWLIDENGYTRYDAFSRIVPLVAAGPNSHRSEVLVSAFAECVATIAPVDGLKLLKGDFQVHPLPSAFLESNASYGRRLAFSMSE